ncbi:sigma-54 dependent transcriptional regulator, partial [Rickettsiales bacterium]|nr:sigma-54 dependent transcriptional regulator [Rickettsiales bacterium]
YNILIVDDDVKHLHSMEHFISSKMNYRANVASGGKEAIDILTSSDSKDIDLVLLDLSMPDADGIEVLNAVKPVNPNLPIIIRTGYDDVNMAVDAMKAGASDFMRKLDSPSELENRIHKALRTHVLNDELNKLKKGGSNKVSFDTIIGKSRAITEMISLGEKVSQSCIPVLIEGESGSGKELLARAIHNASDRSEKPFVAVNCGAIPANLVESILFGHEKGAFTGAIYKTFGKFREADGGTLFLDEVGELTPDIQVKLLRVLQDGIIDPVGADKPIKVDVRLISATNRDLALEVKEHNFREDLYYRLNVFPIYVPPLRDRNGDIDSMVNYFIQNFSEAEGKKIKGISQEVKELFSKYSWPGNIRQLKNTIFRAVVLCDRDMLDISDFPQIVKSNNSITMSAEDQGIYSLKGGNTLLLLDEANTFKALSVIEKEVIKFALEHFNGHMSKVARHLDIGRSTLYRKLHEYGLDADISSNSTVH